MPASNIKASIYIYISMKCFTVVDSFVGFEVFGFKLWHAFRKDGEYEAFLDHVVVRKFC